jgi:hypothetical protein
LIGDGIVFAVVVVFDEAVAVGVLITKGALVPPSYKLALKPDSGASET